MTPVNLVIGALAVWSVVEIWHHGSIFATWRARVELSDSFFARLLLCPFCLSVWVATFSVPFLLPSQEPTAVDLSFYWYGIQKVGYMVLVGFAIARLANLGNDLTHKWCRTPGRNGLEPDSKSAIENPDERTESDRSVPDPAGTPPDFR